ncbi:MAG: sugar-binding domain-containing protein [Phycisphaerae bacterium]
MGKKARRPNKHEYYLNLAEQVALRSTCLRRQFGAVIVNNDEVVATGYGGAPRGTPNCSDIGFCYRGELGARSGEHYEYCRAVHAEQNAIIQAPRRQLLGATLYLVGFDTKTKERWLDTEPCRICKRLIVNARIQTVIARQGERKKRFAVEQWREKSFWELQKKGRGFVPVRPPRLLSVPADEDRARQLVSRFPLSEAVVVQTGSYQEPKLAVARVASRFFISRVRTGNAVALSCGDTILALLEFLPYQPRLRLAIHQLSIEGDPTMIHQAPATLVGLLRAKCSPRSHVYGVHLPTAALVASSASLRADLRKGKFLQKLRSNARRSDYVFLGLGSAGPDSASFWAMAQAATKGKFHRFVKRLEIVGEVNNQPFDSAGRNRSEEIPGFADQVINVLSLEEIRDMASRPAKHKVVMVATGGTKAEGMRVALETGLVNVLITAQEDADRLLDG